MRGARDNVTGSENAGGGSTSSSVRARRSNTSHPKLSSACRPSCDGINEAQNLLPSLTRQSLVDSDSPKRHVIRCIRDATAIQCSCSQRKRLVKCVGKTCRVLCWAARGASPCQCAEQNRRQIPGRVQTKAERYTRVWNHHHMKLE